MLSEQLIKELREIFKDEYGFDIPEDYSEKVASWIAVLFDELAKSQYESLEDNE